MVLTIPQRLAYGLDEAAVALGGASRDTLERAIARGELRSFTVGRRRFISAEELNRFISSREEQA